MRTSQSIKPRPRLATHFLPISTFWETCYEKTSFNHIRQVQCVISSFLFCPESLILNVEQSIRGNHAPLRFLRRLIDDMTQQQPALRPTIGEVIQRFDTRCERLSQWHLRRPGQAHDLFTWVENRIRQVKNTFNRVPPLLSRSPTRPFIPVDAQMRAFYTNVPGP